MSRSTKTQRTVRAIMRYGADADERAGKGYYLIAPEQLQKNLECVVAYLKSLPGGHRSKARMMGATEALKVRDTLIAYPEDWVCKSIRVIERGRAAKFVRPPLNGPMGAGSHYTRSLRAKSHDREVSCADPDCSICEPGAVLIDGRNVE